MNKRILIIYDYERIVPPFMQSLIRCGLNEFDEIKYITPPMPSNYNDTLDYDNVKIITWNRAKRMQQFLLGVCSIFRPRFWEELIKGKMTKQAFLNIGKFYFCSDGFIRLSGKIIRNAIKNDNKVYLLATWMGVEAFTIARIKVEFPEAKAFVLAHSGEVMEGRNPMMHQCFHEFILSQVNKVYFISKKVLDGYLRSMSDIKLHERFVDKISTIYLGSLKRAEYKPAHSTNNKGITLLSCSRIDANKRLDRIISVLSKWDGFHIKWIHIGTGALEKEMRHYASEVSKSNPNVEIVFTGRLNNSGVIEFYTKHSVDLFVNVSRSEGLPISIMEAMSFGIPTVATDVGGTSEIVNSQNGFLMHSDFSDDDFMNILYTFYNLSTSDKQLLKDNAYKTWSENFNAEKNAKELFRDWDL